MFSSSDSDEDWVPEAIANDGRRHRLHHYVPRRYRPRANFDLLPEQNRSRFRLHDGHINQILDRLQDILIHETDRNFALSPEQQIRLSIRYLATGDNFTTVGDSFGVHKSTVSRTLERFLNAVRETLVDQLIRFPGEDGMRYIVKKFRDVAGMPCVMGCIDGSHVDIVAPKTNEEQYVNRHQNHSINLMCVCGPTLRFYYASANRPGSVHDSRVFRLSSLYQQLDQGWRPWPNGILLGDSAYANSNFLIAPIVNPRTLQDERFNIAHKKTRRLIECAYGVLKQRFRCLIRSPIHLDPEKAGLVILACIALHNLLITDDDVAAIMDEFDDDNGDEQAINHAVDRNLEREDDDEEVEGNVRRRAALVRLF